MHYGEATIKRSVPLALALLSASNPQVGLIDTLSKYSHDSDIGVALNAILAMGFIGAGTNNARLAQMLRQLAVYYQREPDALFVVRVAQGLLHMGKGTIGINPFYQDRQIMSKNAVCGLLATLLAFSDAKACEWAGSKPLVLRILIALRSHSSRVSLDVVLASNSHVPTFLDHVRRETRDVTRYRPGGSSSRCRTASWQAANNFGLPDTPISGAAGPDRQGRAGDRGVPPLRACIRRARDLAEESRIREGGPNGAIMVV